MTVEERRLFTEKLMRLEGAYEICSIFPESKYFMFLFVVSSLILSRCLFSRNDSSFHKDCEEKDGIQRSLLESDGMETAQ